MSQCLNFGDIVLYNDDYVEACKNINVKFDLILCDPPYGTTSCEFDKNPIDLYKMWESLKMVAKPNATYIFTAAQPFTSHLVMSNTKWFKYEWIWGKSKCGSPLSAKYRPLAKHENILVFSKGKTKYNPEMLHGEPYKRDYTPTKINNHKYGIKGAKTENGGFRFPDTVLFFQQKWRRQDQVHPTQKPVALMEYLIKTYTNIGDIIFDPFMGSGTIAIAAKNTGRKYVGVEIDKKYFQVAISRISEQ
jgi:site-specific DNA-methyltransferase (adenine-specific)